LTANKTPEKKNSYAQRYSIEILTPCNEDKHELVKNIRKYTVYHKVKQI
jgi:hypothetical protein